MKHFLISSILIGVLPLSNASAQGTPNRQTIIQSADESDFRNYTKTLSSDEFGGRKPLTKYEDITVSYIADEFRKLGLQPANNGSYFQDVPLLDVTLKTKGNKFTVKGPKGKTIFNDYDDYVIWTAHQEKSISVSNTDFVFVGFGINAPEYNWNDYEGIDVRGKVVVALVNDPGYYDASLFKGKDMTYYGRWIYKFEEASRQGAAGVLVVHDTEPASYAWNVVQPSWYEHNLELVNDNGNRDLVKFKGWITRPKAEELFRNAGFTYDELLLRARTRGFQSFSLKSKASISFINYVTGGNSRNVAALLPGTDLKDEYVIYSAHWDHFGIGKPVDGDSIYNGASDNASGVALILTVAKKFRDLGIKPRRSILFIGLTAEEAVLLGSQHYVTHPIVPLEKTAAVLNFDGEGPFAATYDVIYNDLNTASRYVRIAAAAQGRTAIGIPSNGGYRSDHFSFNRVGVPTVVTHPGNSLVNPMAQRGRKPGVYHQPTDEYSDDWDVTGTVQSIGLAFLIGQQIADTDVFPQWNADSPYQRK